MDDISWTSRIQNAWLQMLVDYGDQSWTRSPASHQMLNQLIQSMCARVQCVWTGSKSTASPFRTWVCLSACLKQALSKIISARLLQRSCPPLVGILKGSLLYFVKHAVTLWGFSNTVPEDGSQDLTFYWLLLLRPELAGTFQHLQVQSSLKLHKKSRWNI